MIGKVGKITGDDFAGAQVFGLELRTIGGQYEFGLVASGLRAVAQGRERTADCAGIAGGNMDIVALEDAASDVGLIGVALAQPIDRSRFVLESGGV